MPRIWDRDHTVWKPKPDGIADRLGWLDLPSTMREEASAVTAFADEVRLAGFHHVVLFGMGGSSLAAEVLRQTCAPERCTRSSSSSSTPPYPKRCERLLMAVDPAHTLYIVSSKSGTTIEPNVLYRYFRDVVERDGR